MKNFLFAALLMSGAMMARGQVTAPTTSYLIKAGKFFDSETGVFKTHMVILVKDKKIEAVRTEQELSEADRAGRQVVDLSAYTVLPGLIDCHTHLLYREELHPGNRVESMDMIKELTTEGDAYRAIYGTARARAYLDAGITSVEDLGNSGQYGDVALRRAIEEGLVPGPRMRCAGRGLSSEGGQLPGLIYKHRDLVADEYRVVKGAEDGVQAVRENVTQGADVIKIYANNTPNNTMLSVEEIKAIVGEAHRYGLRVTAHATDNRAVYNAVIGGVDGIEHGYSVDDTTFQLMARKGVIFVPTDGDSLIFTKYAQLANPDDKTAIPRVMGFRRYLGLRLRAALRAGVTVAAGSDDYVDVKLPFAALSKHTIIGYVESGVPVAKALQFATVNASRQLNWAGEVGVLKQGYFADILAVDGDLDTDIHAIMNVHFVMKGGEIVVQ
ncbi:amidohydrolase family protein [Puia sp.]|jgi:imidazolonepropionase-like amidohydrolase|uniref:amidohydrolase family protein n=1 Tax=Puia sp. TaxID=2045100 RepID=UPI002F42901D